MNENGKRSEEQRDMVEALIRAAGPRRAPPEDAYQEVLAASMAALRDKVRVRRQRRAFAWAAAASVLVATAAVLLQWRLPGSEPAQVARIERAIGEVELAAGDGWQPLTADRRPLQAGARLRSQAGARAGILLAGGSSLRLAESTEVLLETSSRLHLERGTIYLDTGLAMGSGLEVVTPAGTARNLGTQFEVQVSGGTMRLRVREGQVEIDRGGELTAGLAGEQLSIDAIGRVTRSRIARNDGAWIWAEGVAPAPDIDGKPARMLLAWVARETGRELVFASDDVERRASAAILHGNIRNLAPLDALAVMLATTDLAYDLNDDAIIEVRAKNVR